MKAEDILKSYVGEGEQIVLPGNPCLQYEGRIDFGKEGGPLWTYPATSVKIRFRGSLLKAVVTNYHAYWDNFLGYLVDGEEHCVKLNESGVSCICLYKSESDSRQNTEVLLFKRQDSCHMVQLHGFIGSSDMELLNCEPLPFRRIEVYGDSVSAGEVSEAVDYCGQPDPEHNGEYSNSYYSYAWLTARKLGARLHDIAQGGISLMDGIGYFMEPEQKGMESLFDKVQYQPRILENSPVALGAGDTREPLPWDFSRYDPQVVIVAVGQNDAHPSNFCGEDYEGEMAVLWRQRYGEFLKKLRKIHPHADIICMTTILNHDANWDRAIEEVCVGCGDSKVHHFLFCNNGKGTHGHIRKPEAEGMAEELAAYITSLGEDIWRDTVRLKEVFARAEKGESLTIGFLGGSITQGSLSSCHEKCYAASVFRWWEGQFPKAGFTYINAGIGGTTSHFGAARVTEDLLYARPDVVFVEFSVNDEDDEHFKECYEGLVRKIWNCDWKPAVVLLHNRFYNDGHSAEYVHDQVGRHYGLPRVCMGDAIYPLIESGRLLMEEITPDGLHPNDKGHAMLTQVITGFLEGVYKEYAESGGEMTLRGGIRECDITSEQLPAPLTLNRYETARRFRNDNVNAVYSSGFLADQAKQIAITDTFRKGWTAGTKGDEIRFRIEGRCIALQYRRTIHGLAPKAIAFVDGDEKQAVLLDGNFDEDWGDCLAMQILLEDSQTESHTVTVRIVEADAVELPFYLASLIVA